VEVRHTAVAVDVSENEVATKFFSGRERLLEIHLRAYFQGAVFCAERSLLNGFAGQISGELFFAESDNRQAAPVNGDAVGYGKRGRHGRSLDGDASASGLEIESLDRADMFDDPSKHSSLISLTPLG
jgi:hypothetical protein